MAEYMIGARRKLFRQLHYRLVRKAGQHRVFQQIELIDFSAAVDARIGVTKHD
jgi:hypothetical protein